MGQPVGAGSIPDRTSPPAPAEGRARADLRPPAASQPPGASDGRHLRPGPGNRARDGSEPV